MEGQFSITTIYGGATVKRLLFEIRMLMFVQMIHLSLTLLPKKAIKTLLWLKLMPKEDFYD